MRCHGITAHNERCKIEVSHGKYCNHHSKSHKNTKSKNNTKNKKKLKFNFLDGENILIMRKILSPQFFTKINEDLYFEATHPEYQGDILRKIDKFIYHFSIIIKALIKDRNFYLEKYKHATDYPSVMSSILKDVAKKHLTRYFGLINTTDIDTEHHIFTYTLDDKSSFREYYDNFVEVFNRLIANLTVGDIIEEATRQNTYGRDEGFETKEEYEQEDE